MNEQKSILIIDSGATSWKIAYMDQGDLDGLMAETQGYNVAVDAVEILMDRLRWTEDEIGAKPDEVYAYLAGLTEARREVTEKTLEKHFPNAQIHVHNDLVALEHGLSGGTSAWLGILGTGMNLGFWEDGKIVKTVASLGYVLGDEGSGRHLVKVIMRKYYRHAFDQELQTRLSEIFTLDYGALVDAVYKEGRWPELSGQYGRLLSKLWHEPEIEKVVHIELNHFLEEVLLPEVDKKKARIILSGGVAEAYKDYLCTRWKNLSDQEIEVWKNPLQKLCKRISHEH